MESDPYRDPHRESPARRHLLYLLRGPGSARGRRPRIETGPGHWTHPMARRVLPRNLGSVLHRARWHASPACEGPVATSAAWSARL